jgi:hypothetical protein
MRIDMDDELAFYNETCKTCLYYHVTPGHTTWNVCRFWVPSSTAINQYAIQPHVADPHETNVMDACGCYKKNPFLKEEQPVDDNPKATPASEIGEVS